MSVLDKFVSQQATLSMPITTYQVLLEQAALDERDRIVALLESYEGWKTVMEHDSDSSLESVIALIKGENK